MRRAGEWSGWPLAEDQFIQLRQFGTWLSREAIPSGALGPNEGVRLHTRHLADSLVFAAAWRGLSPPPRLVDLGSGVGLPGIPLAILWPATRVTLVERRERRADLARRAVRRLALPNVEVAQQEAVAVTMEAEMVVARAVAAPAVVAEWAGRIVVAGGVVAMGGSWTKAPVARPGEEVMEIPGEVLDRPVWLRIMAAS